MTAKKLQPQKILLFYSESKTIIISHLIPCDSASACEPVVAQTNTHRVTKPPVLFDNKIKKDKGA